MELIILIMELIIELDLKFYHFNFKSFKTKDHLNDF